MISMTSEYVSESTSRSGSEGDWSWDPESFTIRMNSLQDTTTVADITPALSSPTLSMSRCSTLKPISQQSSPPFQSALTTSPIHNARSLSTPKYSTCPTSETPSHADSSCSVSFTSDASSFSDFTLSQTVEEGSSYSPYANASAGTIGLGITGLINKDGTSFDGMGAIGLSRSTEDEEIDSAEYTGTRKVSFALIDEVSFTFSSSPLQNPALRRVFATHFATIPALAPRTPTPYPHEFMEAAGGEYFPTPSVQGLSSPLQNVSATSNLSARLPTPYPRNTTGEYFSQQNVGLCSPAQAVFTATRFATPTLAARTPTPYPHEFMEAAGGEYFPIQNVRFASPLQRASATSTFAARIPTPYPRYSMEVAGGEYFPIQNVRFASPLQRVFATSTFAARIPTPYPRYTMEVAGGEYFPESESDKPLQHPSLQRVLATRVGPPTIGARTPTPYPHDSMEAAGGEYFPQQPLQRKNAGLGLGIFGLASSDGGSFDGMGSIVGLHKIVDNVQAVSRALIEEVAYTFSSTPQSAVI